MSSIRPDSTGAARLWGEKKEVRSGGSMDNVLRPPGERLAEPATGVSHGKEEKVQRTEQGQGWQDRYCPVLHVRQARACGQGEEVYPQGLSSRPAARKGAEKAGELHPDQACDTVLLRELCSACRARPDPQRQREASAATPLNVTCTSRCQPGALRVQWVDNTLTGSWYARWHPAHSSRSSS